MRKIFINKILLLILPLVLCFLALALSVRGITGNPASQELDEKKWIEGPLELSPERGRYALLYSLIEDNSFTFSVDIARFATPDVGIHNGKYVSLFAPLVSFAVLPGYVIGKILGASQVGTYSVVALFAFFNVLLVKAIAMKLGAKSIPSTIGGMLFVFASPAFVYGVSLFQHHISAFLLLTILYLSVKYKNWFVLPMILLLFACAIMIDYPNALLFSPALIFLVTRMVWIEVKAQRFFLHLKPLYILALPIVILPAIFYAWFSQNSYGTPFQLSGTVKSVQAIDENGRPINEAEEDPMSKAQRENEAKTREAYSFFKTRNILNGLYIHFLSPDRGMLYYTPVLFLGLLGAFSLWKTRRNILSVFMGIVGINIALYSMWGDPWGGWAFGSRYLVPSYAILAILLAVALTQLRRKLLFIILLFVLAVYSVGVNTLGALTTSANPPQVEVLALEQQTGKEEKYTYERNWDYLLNNGSKSFVYNTYLKEYISPLGFYLAVAGSISFVIVLLILAQIRRKNG